MPSDITVQCSTVSNVPLDGGQWLVSMVSAPPQTSGSSSTAVARLKGFTGVPPRTYIDIFPQAMIKSPFYPCDRPSLLRHFLSFSPHCLPES